MSRPLAIAGYRTLSEARKSNPEIRQLYWIWSDMLTRCRRSTSKNFPRYGGRGISVCAEWESFERFYNDMPPRPKGFTLERIENNGNYEPGNCKWATITEQANNRSTNTNITCDGKTLTLTQWERVTGIDRGTIRTRIKSGWTLTQALSIKPSFSNSVRKSDAAKRRYAAK